VAGQTLALDLPMRMWRVGRTLNPIHTHSLTKQDYNDDDDDDDLF